MEGNQRKSTSEIELEHDFSADGQESDKSSCAFIHLNSRESTSVALYQILDKSGTIYVRCKILSHENISF